MNRNRIGFVIGILLFALTIILPNPAGMSDQAVYVAATAILMATWWSTEAIPIPATALLPIVLYPLLGVMDTQDITLSYANHLVFLFLGGFLIAVTIEKWDLHRRIALHTVAIVGTSPNRIILGFMLATAFLSMWISNTATAMLMVTIGLAVINQQNLLGEDRSQFGLSLMLGIAYAASIGGVSTLIGTPPNAILAGIAESHFGVHIRFSDWLIFALPLSITMLIITWLYLTRVVNRGNTSLHPESRALFNEQIRQLGKVNSAQLRVFVVFTGVALMWILHGLFRLPLFSSISDASIAIFGALLLFLIPSGMKKHEFLLDWSTAKTIPWDILILFGGGFALANGFASSGLTDWIGNELRILEGSNIVYLVIAITTVVVFLTEVTSNTATASLLIPVVGAMAIGMDIHPLITMTAVAIAASYAFMLPVATPPNAIVFASKVVTIPQMVKAGFLMNVIGIILISAFIMLFIPESFDTKI